jgi:hypothetical protein
MELPEIALGDGRKAKFVRRPKAADASRAHRIAGPKGTDIDRSAAYLAAMVEIDGAPVNMEAVLGLYMEDYEALVAAIPVFQSTPPL